MQSALLVLFSNVPTIDVQTDTTLCAVRLVYYSVPFTRVEFAFNTLLKAYMYHISTLCEGMHKPWASDDDVNRHKYTVEFIIKANACTFAQNRTMCKRIFGACPAWKINWEYIFCVWYKAPLETYART